MDDSRIRNRVTGRAVFGYAGDCMPVTGTVQYSLQGWRAGAAVATIVIARDLAVSQLRWFPTMMHDA